MTKTKWCVIPKTKSKSEFAVKMSTATRSQSFDLCELLSKWSIHIEFYFRFIPQWKQHIVIFTSWQTYTININKHKSNLIHIQNNLSWLAASFFHVTLISLSLLCDCFCLKGGCADAVQIGHAGLCPHSLWVGADPPIFDCFESGDERNTHVRLNVLLTGTKNRQNTHAGTTQSTYTTACILHDGWYCW